MRWQFLVAGVLALGALVVIVGPSLVAGGAGRPGSFLTWSAGLLLLVAGAAVFEWGWVLARQDDA